MTTALRALARVVCIVLAAAALLLGPAGTSAAHPTLLFTDPGAETAVSTAPQSITLMFNEAVTVGPGAVIVFDHAGREMAMDAATTARGGEVVSARPARTLPPDTYTVRWRVTGADGDLVEAEFRFAVGLALTGDADEKGGDSPSWPDAALRWLLLAGLAMAFGGAIAERFTASARAERATLPAVRSQVVWGIAVGSAGVAGLVVRIAQEAGGIDGLWQGQAGRVVLTQSAGFALALGIALCGRPRWVVVPLLVVIAAESVRSHASVEAAGWGALLTGVHLTAAAVWVGALVHTARAAAAWRQEPAAIAWVLSSYMRLAIALFLIVVATGVVTTLLLVPLSAWLASTYGRVLLIKLGLVVLATGLALSARRAARRPDPNGRTRTVMRTEGAVLTLVVAVTAVLVSTAPPTSAPEPGPPPPVGPVLALGALAGQVGVSIAASEGQLVVRLSSPRRGDYYAPDPKQRYSLSGRLDNAAAGPGSLDFRGCGRGCFVTPATWNVGDNILTLQAAAEGWHGDMISLLVPWPTRPGADDLARAVAAMREADLVTVYEAVTSDTSTTAREPQQLQLSADFFLSQEPYLDGTAPIAARISADGRSVRLALGYPAASINVVLTLDARGRIVEETLTDAKHLVTRRLVYPDGDG